jgi:hypothetical protein
VNAGGPTTADPKLPPLTKRRTFWTFVFTAWIVGIVLAPFYEPPMTDPAPLGVTIGIVSALVLTFALDCYVYARNVVYWEIEPASPLLWWGRMWALLLMGFTPVWILLEMTA